MFEFHIEMLIKRKAKTKDSKEILKFSQLKKYIFKRQEITMKDVFQKI